MIITDIYELDSVIRSIKLQTHRIITTNGVFDQLHHGHIEYLKASKRLGDVLIVGINTDSAVHSLKGPEKPLNSQTVRANDLHELKSVDHVVIFDSVLPNEFLSIVKPMIHTKGKDYTLMKMPEREIVEKNGGHVVLMEFLRYQTTIVPVKFFNED